MAGGGVTLRDIYDAQDRIERKLDERLGKIEGRIDSLETVRDRALGIMAVFSLFVSAASTYVWNKIVGKS